LSDSACCCVIVFDGADGRGKGRGVDGGS
jgi:hypothetical protein